MNPITIRENGSMLVVQGGTMRLPINCWTMTQAVVHAIKAGAVAADFDEILDDYKATRPKGSNFMR